LLFDPAAEEWIHEHVTPTGEIDLVQERFWSTVLRVPVADGQVWLKACTAVHGHEVALTAALAERWPDRLPAVIAHDEASGWLLLADGGTAMDSNRDLEHWVALLPRYAELQRGEADLSESHLAAGVPDQRIPVLTAAYDAMLSRGLPMEPGEIARLRAFQPEFERLCAELASGRIPPSIQHDDLHNGNLYLRGDAYSIIDWGDACIAHPFETLLATFRNIERLYGIPSTDSWFTRLKAAYLEPWDQADMVADLFDLAMRVAAFSRAATWIRHYDAVPPEIAVQFAPAIPTSLRRFLADVVGI
jgi:hypothetical protein